ncbi:MAG TPA: DUF4349 domain-containing protein [Actinomycetota bacterium]|nr:DUF4349 domain-containing protein [Actinomycetota bacterium]
MRNRVIATMVVMVVLTLGAVFGARDSSEPAISSAARDAAGTTGGGGNEMAVAPDPGAERADADANDGAFAAPPPDARAVQQPVPDLPPLPQTGPGAARVIKNISLELRIERDEFQRKFARAGSLAEQFGGFVTNSQVSETEDRFASGSLTIRVPSNRFEEAVTRLKELGRVTAEDRSGQDVSREFVDLEARLTHAKTEEAFFLRLMGEAEGISDMIQIQSQLSGVQMRIEQIQGQLNFLNDQTSFSTISVRIYEPGAAAGPPRGLAAAWQGAVEGFQSVVGGLVVALGWLAPFALIALVGLLVFRLRNRPKSPVGSDLPPPVQS